ncbi:MAG: site-specific integrase [Firmicutes bacterium]|nr:site-specific integrase [Bacillota bacterium]
MARGNGEGTIYQRKSDGLWCGQVTIGTDPKTGKIKRKTFYGKRRKDVARKMNNLNHKLNTGTYIEPSDITLLEWLNKWIEGRKASVSYSTYRNYKVMIRNHIKPELGKIKLKDLTARQVQDLLNDKLENGKINDEGGLSARTVKYIYTTIHAGLEQAIKERIIPSNVCKAVEVPKSQREKKLHTWNKKQVQKFLNAAKEYKFYPLFYLALNTGMRQGELLGLQWKDIDFNNKLVEVKRQIVRTDKGLIYKKVKTDSGNRVIPVTDEVISFLEEHKTEQEEYIEFLGEDVYQDDDLVGCSQIGTPIDPRNLYRKFKKIIEENKLPEIRFHDLRHTFATLYLEAGGDIIVLQHILGHSSITVTIDTYSHITKDMLVNASKTIENMFNIDE